MKKVNSSPDRNTFQKEKYLERCIAKDEEPNQDYLDLFEKIMSDNKSKFADPDSCVNNLEYDLRSNEWIVTKAKNSRAYSQNLYAALCNNEFMRNDTWPILKKETWSCSWRYAGGIIADMIEKGDYIDWYCSGIGGVGLSADDAVDRHTDFVGEGHVTEEIRQDLFKLGWLVVENKEEN